MPRYPRIWLGCTLAARRERRFGLPSIERARADSQRPAAPRPGGVRVTDCLLDVPGGTIPLRLYRPRVQAAQPAHPLPAHVFAHGGAFVAGSIEETDGLCCEYALHADCLVVSVGYRLAPEHRWPTAAEDVYAALQWVCAEANTLGADAARLSVGGASVGGGLAAAAAMMARDRDELAPLRLQLLEIPALDLTLGSPSATRYATGYLLTRAWLEQGYALYAPDEGQRRDRYASPLLAPDLAGLAPAFVLTCQYDPLRDDGERYARRLRAAGVPVQAVRARGHVHSSTYSAMRSAGRYRRISAEALRRAHHG